MARKEWKPLPAVTALTGAAEFFKTAIVERFTKELFGGSPTEIRRFQGPANERDEASLPLAVVLDELRTPSFFSPHRLVILEQANAFIALHAEYLVRHLKGGFGGGYLILLVEGKLDGRTRFAKHLAKEGWIVECAQPYDRPPPWDTRAPAWDSELTHWVVAQAKAKGLQIDPPTAFLLHERAGTDLAVLDEEIEKIATYLASKNTSVADGDSIQAVIGDLREDTVFVTLELFLEGRRREALQSLHRLFEHGLPTDRGTSTREPTAIALQLVGALLSRVRALRRAQDMAADGMGPEQWVGAGLVQRPFLPRFQREMATTPPQRIERIVARLYDIDKAIKSGGDAEKLLELLVLEHSG